MNRIAVLSDIHGNLLALEQVVVDIQGRHVECVFNLGDHASGPLWPKETIQFLMRQDWIQISGNHDRQLVTQPPECLGRSDRFAFQQLGDNELDWLRTLPPEVAIQNHFLLIHGTPSQDTVYLLETVEYGQVRQATSIEIRDRLDEIHEAVILCGHSHIPRVVKLPDVLIVNPGSVGLPAYEDDSPEYHVMETGSQHARYATLEYNNDNWSPELISVSYDHQTAADQARRNGRPDWEVGIRTGFLNEYPGRYSAHDQAHLE